MPLLSIVTPTYNSSATIRRTLDSIYSQSYNDFEHIVVDAVSNDGTLDIVKEYANGITRIISEPDKGIYDAMNKGVRAAMGEYVVILNSDDMYAKSTVLEEMMKFIQANDLDIAWGDISYLGEGVIKRYWSGGYYKPGKFNLGWVPPHPAFFCRRGIFEKSGYFRLDMPVAADYELMFRFIECCETKCDYLPLLVTKMTPGGNSGNIKNIFIGNFNDIYNSYKLNNKKFPWQFLFFKPFKKLSQFRIKF